MQVFPDATGVGVEVDIKLLAVGSGMVVERSTTGVVATTVRVGILGVAMVTGSGMVVDPSTTVAVTTPVTVGVLAVAIVRGLEMAVDLSTTGTVTTPVGVGSLAVAMVTAPVVDGVLAVIMEKVMVGSDVEMVGPSIEVTSLWERELPISSVTAVAMEDPEVAVVTKEESSQEAGMASAWKLQYSTNSSLQMSG